MRILCCGDRNWSDCYKVREALKEYEHDTIVIHGCCRGADEISGKTAKLFGWEVIEFPADWKQYGRSAGPIRNRKMLVEGKPDLVIAFHSNIERSKGTANMLAQAKKANIPYKVIE